MPLPRAKWTQLGLGAVLADLCEAARDQDHDSRDTLRRALAHDVDHGGGGDGDDREVDGAGMSITLG